MNISRHSFDQMVGGEDLALLVENQRRETDSGESFAGDARAFKLQARRQGCAAGEMRTQLVQLVHDAALDWSAFGPSRHDKNDVLAGRDWNGRADNPPDAKRAPHVAVKRFPIPLVEGEDVELG